MELLLRGEHRSFVDLYFELAYKMTQKHIAKQFLFIQLLHLFSDVLMDKLQEKARQQLALPELHPVVSAEEDIQPEIRYAVDKQGWDAENVERRFTNGRQLQGLNLPDPASFDNPEELKEESLCLTVCFTDAIIGFANIKLSMIL